MLSKTQKIEEVVQELYGVFYWIKEPLKKSEKLQQSSEFNFKSPLRRDIHTRQSFKEWKQENGFFFSLFELAILVPLSVFNPL